MAVLDYVADVKNIAGVRIIARQNHFILPGSGIGLPGGIYLLIVRRAIMNRPNARIQHEFSRVGRMLVFDPVPAPAVNGCTGPPFLGLVPKITRG